MNSKLRIITKEQENKIGKQIEITWINAQGQHYSWWKRRNMDIKLNKKQIGLSINEEKKERWT